MRVTVAGELLLRGLSGAQIRGRSGALDGNLVRPRFDQTVFQPAAHLTERPFFISAFFVIHHHTARQGKIMATSTVTIYRRTLAAVITAFTGIPDPFEPPAKPDSGPHTHRESVEESVERVLPLLREPEFDA